MEKLVKIYSEFIKLDALLKYVGICSTGGEAKIFILDNDILVNNEVCKQRGKKIRPGDIVEVNDIVLQVTD